MRLIPADFCGVISLLSSQRRRQLLATGGGGGGGREGGLTPLQKYSSNESTAKYTWGSGGRCKSPAGPVQSPGGGAGEEILEAFKVLYFTLPKIVKKSTFMGASFLCTVKTRE